MHKITSPFPPSLHSSPYSYGDMRIAMNTLMINKWRALGSYQSRYVPGMIGPFLKVSLVPHTSKIYCDAVEVKQLWS